MKKSESKDAEVARLAKLLCSSSSAVQVPQMVQELREETVQELCTSILANGHTLLHLLAQRQKLQTLRSLLQHKGATADVLHTRNAKGATPLHMALQHNALFSAKVLLDHGANPSEVVYRHKGTTLLHLMVTCDRPQAVTLLLEEGAEANARDRQGRTPFHLAAIYGHARIATILMRYDQCDVNAVDDSGHTGVMLAITNNNPELAKQLVEAPALDIVRRDNDGMSCLHLAVSLGQLEVVRTLLRRNTANINSKEYHMGRTPIHLACALVCDADGIVSSNCLLGNASGDAVERNGNGDAPKNSDLPGDSVADSVGAGVKVNVPPIAVSLGNPEHSRFKSHQKNLPAMNGYLGKSTPRTSRTSRTPRTSRAGTQVRTSRTSTPTAFTPRKDRYVDSSSGEAGAAPSPRRMTRTSYEDSSSIQHNRHSISVDHVAHTPRPKSSFLYTSLKAKQSVGSESHNRAQRPSTAPAVSNLNPQFSATLPTSLLTLKIPSVATGRESTVSHRSRDSVMMSVTPFNVGMIRSRLVALLLHYDADANLMTAFRKSPLHITSLMGAADVMALLLPRVTNINVLSASNKTALHLAVEGGYTSLVSQLISAGANLMLRDISGMTALHLAARLGHTDMVSLLLKARVDKNCCDFQQRMPLHHACLHNHSQVINLLIKTGACLDRADDDGFLPLEYQDRHSATKTTTVQRENGSSVPDSPVPHLTVTNTDTDDEKQSEVNDSVILQRRRKMGIIHSADSKKEPKQNQKYKKQEPSQVVLFSIVAL